MCENTCLDEETTAVGWRGSSGREGMKGWRGGGGKGRKEREEGRWEGGKEGRKEGRRKEGRKENWKFPPSYIVRIQRESSGIPQTSLRVYPRFICNIYLITAKKENKWGVLTSVILVHIQVYSILTFF